MKISLFDTTLRDGTQSEDVSFTVNDKIKIAHVLDDLGIDYIEAGWPGSNPKDLEFFEAVKKENFNHSKITAFGSTRKAQNTCAADPSIQALLQTETKVVCIVAKSWDFHVIHALNVSLAENLTMIKDSVSYLKSKVEEVIYDAEHFFDGYKNNPDYAIQTLLTAEQNGADFLVLCDTNGGSMPWEIEQTLAKIKTLVKTPLGIHTHNDSEVAIANSLVAVKQGASMVQGTINGVGERCGNANLVSIIIGLQEKMQMHCLPAEKYKKLTQVSHLIREIANLYEWKNQPYVGKSAFAHKGGIHVSAVLKHPSTYEHMDPEKIGNRRRVLVSDLSGLSNIRYKIKELNLGIQEDDPILPVIVQQIKEMENKGYTYEATDASLELLILRTQKKLPHFFEILGYRIIDEQREGEQSPISEATVQISVPKKNMIHTASLGGGPVDALNQAVCKALHNYYPNISQIKLTDYKVRILDANKGTEATTRVLITSADSTHHWTTVGVDQDIIRASYLALIDAIQYKLYLDTKK